MSLLVFKFEEKDIRMLVEGESILFCAIDIARILGYKNQADAVSKHCKPKGVVKRDTLTSGGSQEITFIDEANMYRLIMSSKMKDAERFQDWVVEEVIPSIRKTGSYSVQKQITPAQMLLQQAQILVLMEEQIQEVKEEIKEIKAKATSSPADYYAIAGYAALINRKVDYKKAAELGRKASSLCKNLGYTTGSMPDPRFGTVKLYPVDVLKTVFE